MVSDGPSQTSQATVLSSRSGLVQNVLTVPFLILYYCHLLLPLSGKYKMHACNIIVYIFIVANNPTMGCDDIDDVNPNNGSSIESLFRLH